MRNNLSYLSNTVAKMSNAFRGNLGSEKAYPIRMPS